MGNTNHWLRSARQAGGNTGRIICCASHATARARCSRTCSGCTQPRLTALRLATGRATTTTPCGSATGLRCSSWPRSWPPPVSPTLAWPGAAMPPCSSRRAVTSARTPRNGTQGSHRWRGADPGMGGNSRPAYALNPTSSLTHHCACGTQVICYGSAIEASLQRLCNSTAPLPQVIVNPARELPRARCASPGWHGCLPALANDASAACAAVRAAYSEDWALYRRHCLHAG